MQYESRGITRQNLGFSLAIALFALIAACGIWLADGLVESRDRKILAQMAQVGDGSSLILERVGREQRLFRWKIGNTSKFGVVLGVGEPGYSAVVAILFTSGGEVEAIHFVSSVTKRHLAENEEFFNRFLGFGYRAWILGRNRDISEPALSSQATTFARSCALALTATAIQVKSIAGGGK